MKKTMILMSTIMLGSMFYLDSANAINKGLLSRMNETVNSTSSGVKRSYGATNFTEEEIEDLLKDPFVIDKSTCEKLEDKTEKESMISIEPFQKIQKISEEKAFAEKEKILAGSNTTSGNISDEEYTERKKEEAKKLELSLNVSALNDLKRTVKLFSLMDPKTNYGGYIRACEVLIANNTKLNTLCESLKHRDVDLSFECEELINLASSVDNCRVKRNFIRREKFRQKALRYMRKKKAYVLMKNKEEIDRSTVKAFDQKISSYKILAKMLDEDIKSESTSLRFFSQIIKE